MKFSDVLIVLVALVATGIILEVGIVYGDNLFDAPQWPVWQPVTETEDPWLILHERV